MRDGGDGASSSDGNALRVGEAMGAASAAAAATTSWARVRAHVPYDMKRLRQVPDILCMGWRNSAAARAFACAWAQRVARGSMREQLSFDYVRVTTSPLLSVQFLQEPHWAVGGFRLHTGGTNKAADPWRCVD